MIALLPATVMLSGLEAGANRLGTSGSVEGASKKEWAVLRLPIPDSILNSAQYHFPVPVNGTLTRLSSGSLLDMST